MDFSDAAQKGAVRKGARQLLSVDGAYHDSGPEAVVALQKHPQPEVYVIRAKNKDHREEAMWHKLNTCLPALLDPESDDDGLTRKYNSSLVSKGGI